MLLVQTTSSRSIWRPKSISGQITTASNDDNCEKKNGLRCRLVMLFVCWPSMVYLLQVWLLYRSFTYAVLEKRPQPSRFTIFGRTASYTGKRSRRVLSGTPCTNETCSEGISSSSPHGMIFPFTSFVFLCWHSKSFILLLCFLIKPSSCFSPDSCFSSVLHCNPCNLLHKFHGTLNGLLVINLS